MAQIDWFPKAQSKPITIKSLFPEVERIRSYGAAYKIKWLDSNRPQPTIGKDHAQKPTRWLINEKEHKPTTQELQIIGSFPLAFRFANSENDAWNNIGNSVPPLMMRAIASQIGFLFFRLDEMKTSKMDYPAILEEAWQQHLAPRKSDAPTVISLFAGCGGSSLGYSMAGYRELLAVEWNDNAIATFKLNFPDVSVYHGDIHKLTVKQCLEMTGLQSGELDLLDGSPPCQGFSIAGKRQMTDKRNQLYMEFVRLLRGLQPKVFVMENVSGLVKGKMKLIFANIIQELKASGYEVRCKLLNAMYFNVPQSRQRLIWIGIRKGLQGEVGFPKAESQPIKVKDAIGHLPIGKRGQHQPQVLRAWGLSKPNQFLRKACRYVGSYQSVRLDPNKPSPTQVKSHFNWHYLIARQLIRTEAALISSFPCSFKWIENKLNYKGQIGNCVPPLFMRAMHNI